MPYGTACPRVSKGKVRYYASTHQEAVLESPEAGISRPLSIGRGDVVDVRHMLKEWGQVVNLQWGRDDDASS